MRLISLLPKDAQILKFHQSLCPGCVDEEKFNKMKIDAVTFARHGKVWQMKKCEEHGIVKEVSWSDYEMYKKAERFQDPGIKILNPNIDKSEFEIDCPTDCGLCAEHESHTGLGNIVVTNRCDLTCWYCLPGEEELLVKRNEVVSLEKIENLKDADSHATKINIDDIEGEFTPLEDAQVLTFSSGIVAWTKIKKIFRRPYSGPLLEIRTKTGRRIKVTPEHKIAIMDGKNILKKPAGELYVGDRLLAGAALPAAQDIEIDLLEAFSTLPVQETQKIYVHNIGSAIAGSSGGLFYSWRSRDTMPLSEFYKMPDTDYEITFGRDASKERLPRKLKISKDLAKLIGYFISDGHYTYKDLRITCKDRMHAVEIIDCIKRLGLKPSILDLEKHGRASQIVIGSRNMRLVFKYVLGIPEKASGKRVPKIFFGMSYDLKVALLSGLFNGDGFVTRGKRHASMGIATVSRGLARDITYLLSSLGVFCRIYTVSKEKMKGANYDLHKIYVSGHDMEKLSTALELKQSHKARLLGLTPRRGARIERLGDFVIDHVKEIKRSKTEGYVYDIEVESAEHVFLAGDGILVSNCFFYAKEGEPIYEPTMEQIEFMLKRMKNEKPVGANSIQFTGGEPTLRDDLTEIVATAKRVGYDHVQLNTNGINLSRGPELAQNLRAAGVSNLYLSFDGVTPQTNPKNYWEAPKAIENCGKAGIGVVLVPTVIGSINDHELGDIIRFAHGHISNVRAVNFQPVSLVGRMPDALRKKQRITIPGAIRRIEAQTDGQIGKEHWFPVPCAKQITDFIEAIKQEPKYRLSIHFQCGMATYAFHDTATGELVPLPKFFDIEGFFEYLGELTREINSSNHKTFKKSIVVTKLIMNIKKYVDNDKKPKNLNFVRMLTGTISGANYHGMADFHNSSLFLGMMHFQDPHNWDIDRIHKCDIHYATPDGRILPFCTFNVIPELYRDRVQRKFSISQEEWEKKTGKSLHNDKFHRNLTKEEQTKIMEEYDKYRKYKEKTAIESDWGDDANDNDDATTVETELQDAFVPIGNIVNALSMPAGSGKTGVSYTKKKHTMEHPAGGGCASGSCQ
ncbi:radical SAM protein [archaeon]|nr:radical SAM protein [archaeon]